MVTRHVSEGRAAVRERAAVSVKLQYGVRHRVIPHLRVGLPITQRQSLVNSYQQSWWFTEQQLKIRKMRCFMKTSFVNLVVVTLIALVGCNANSAKTPKAPATDAEEQSAETVKTVVNKPIIGELDDSNQKVVGTAM